MDNLSGDISSLGEEDRKNLIDMLDLYNNKICGMLNKMINRRSLYFIKRYLEGIMVFGQRH